MDQRDFEKSIDEETLEIIINCGALNYRAERMAVLLDLPEDVINKYLKNQKSEFYKAYQKGKIISEYKIDMKLFQLAKTGDLKAIEELEYRKQNR